MQENLKRAMWRAEALRHRMGDKPLVVTSGFRSKRASASVGGSGSGQHPYGTAIDLIGVSGTPSYCTIASTRYAGFGIFGPGYPGHDDHVVDIRVRPDLERAQLRHLTRHNDSSAALGVAATAGPADESLSPAD